MQQNWIYVYMSTCFHVSFVFFAHTFTDSDVMGNYVFAIVIFSLYWLHEISWYPTFSKKSIVVLNDDNFSFYGHEGRICLLYFLIAICYQVLPLCVLFRDSINVSFDDMW